VFNKLLPGCWLILGCLSVRAQIDHPAKHSLPDQSYTYLLDRIGSGKLPGNDLARYTEAYLSKAKAEANWPEIMEAYKHKLHQSPKPLRLKYADSMLYAARRTGQEDLVGSAYLTKGIVYYDRKDHISALDNYIAANNHIAKGNDEYLKHKVRFNIGQIKYYLGYYNEAAGLLSNCVAYYAREKGYPYLASLHSLGLCYNRQGRYAQSSHVNRQGLAEAQKANNPDAIAHFTQSEGINKYSLKQYPKAIQLLNRALPQLAGSNDFANEAVTHFYLAKSHLALGDYAAALTNFTKTEQVCSREQYIRPDLRETYEFFIDYYKKRNDLPSQLAYINRLLKIDGVLMRNYRYLSGKIHKEYDTRELLGQKAGIEQSLDQKKKMNQVLVALVTMLLGCVAYLWYRHLKNKQRFRDLMRQPIQTPKLARETNDTLDINPDVVAAVLKQLDKFEQNNKYLENDMTLSKMALLFDSNTKYVSMIIAHYKGKKSIDYINDLKVDYIIGKLKSETRYRLYTNKALGEEAGFNTTQHFTRAFLKRAGISPTFFVEELKNSGM
jgi:tetratricopeptide (TPR) repeat protein